MLKTIFFLSFIFSFFLTASVFSEEVKENVSPLMEGLSQIAETDSGTVYAITLIQDGISETKYFHPGTRCHNCYSVAKLFTVTALGILEDRKLLTTDDEVYPIFQDRFPDNFDPKWKEVRICDVLTHRIGFESGFLDIDSENMREWGTDDFLSLVFSHPLKYKPGEKSVYSDAAFYLASRIFTEKSGERLDDFLIREIANPLGFAEFAYAKSPAGYPIGATGLYISTEDMAKLGQLYFQKGIWNGKQILSETFVEKVFQKQFELHPVKGSSDAFGKGGMNGQFLYINRKTGTVFAIHTFRGDVSAYLDFLSENDK